MTEKVQGSGSSSMTKGYQPRPLSEGYRPSPQGGHQPTGSGGSPTSPPSNTPNQGSAGKK